MTSLPQKIVALHRSLRAASLPHAFGGALALAFCTRDPRGTDDIDLNVFIPVSSTDILAAALPAPIKITSADRSVIRRDGQVRTWWDLTPVDLFFATDPFHDEVAHRCRAVPFGELDGLPVLSCPDLGVFKAMYARPKDEVDVATMADAGTIDVDALERHVATLLGNYEDRALFFRSVRAYLVRLHGR